MKKIQVGNPYNVTFSNKYLASQYLQETRKEATNFETGEDNEKNKKHQFSKTTFKRLKTIFACVGGCIILVGYILLMVLGGVVCILVL